MLLLMYQLWGSAGEGMCVDSVTQGNPYDKRILAELSYTVVNPQPKWIHILEGRREWGWAMLIFEHFASFSQ